MLQLWLWPSSSELFQHLTFSSTLSLGQLRYIIRIRCLNFCSNFYHLLWWCCLFLATSLAHDANTFNACGEMMSGWQDSFVWSWPCNLLPTNQWPVADGSPISCWNRSATDWQPISTDQPLQLVSDGNQSCISCMWRLILICDWLATLLQPLLNLAATSATSL